MDTSATLNCRGSVILLRFRMIKDWVEVFHWKYNCPQQQTEAKNNLTKIDKAIKGLIIW